MKWVPPKSVFYFLPQSNADCCYMPAVRHQMSILHVKYQKMNIKYWWWISNVCRKCSTCSCHWSDQREKRQCPGILPSCMEPALADNFSLSSQLSFATHKTKGGGSSNQSFLHHRWNKVQLMAPLLPVTHRHLERSNKWAPGNSIRGCHDAYGPQSGDQCSGWESCRETLCTFWLSWWNMSGKNEF